MRGRGRADPFLSAGPSPHTPASGVGAVAPDGQACLQVFQADLLGAMKARVDQGEARDVRFGPCGGGAGEPRPRS